MEGKTIAQKWMDAYTDKESEQTRFDTITEQLEAYEKHLEVGEDYIDQAFRFPELSGYVYRKYDNIIKYMPETKIQGHGDSAVQLQSAIENVKRRSTYERERADAILDACTYGTGWLFLAPVDFYQKIKGQGEVLSYSGLACEVVDTRDVFPAMGSTRLHDHTGRNRCPYIFRRRILYYDTFMNLYSNMEYAGTKVDQKIIDKVQPVTWDAAQMIAPRTPTRKESTERNYSIYVGVLEYWDVENDEVKFYVNDIESCFFDSKNGIPFSHKMLPFHAFYDYKRRDSIFGFGEVELNMPYHQYRERWLQLAIENATLSQQPAYITSDKVSLNPDESPLQPGAQLILRGMSHGSLKDHIMEFRAGGVTQDSFAILETIENSRIALTGDDTQALYENPNQLATQTRAKEAAREKRIATNNLLNTIDTQYYIDYQIVCLIKNEFAEPYEENGKTEYRKIYVDNYTVAQNRPDEKISKFRRKDGVRGQFYLNKKVVEQFNDLDIEIIPATLDAEIKADKNQRFMQLFKTILETAQLNPALFQEIGMSLGGTIKAMAKELDLNLAEVFPDAPFAVNQDDIIDIEYRALAMGITPVPQAEKYDLQKRYMALLEFAKTKTYKGFTKDGIQAYNQFKDSLIESLRNYYVRLTQQPASNQNGANPAEGLSLGAGSPDLGQAAQGQPVQGGAGVSVQSA